MPAGSLPWRSRSKIHARGASCNMLESLPQLKYLEYLSLHDNQLTTLPELANCAVLHTLRLDRNPLPELPVLPPSLRVLHLEGCPLVGTLDQPENLPVQVRALPCLEDLQLPDGSHIGEFFGTPLPSLLRPILPGDLLPKIDGTESLYAPESQSNSTEEIKEKPCKILDSNAFNDQFFGGMGGMGMGMPSMFGKARGGGGGGGDPFTDPFRLFEQDFDDMQDVHDPREYMLDVHGRQSQSENSRSGGGHTSRQDPYSDPFYGGMGGMMGGMGSMMQPGGSWNGGFSSFSSSSFGGCGGGGGNR